MPNYDYRCDSCGDFNFVRSFDEHARYELCPECGGVCPQILSSVAFARSTVQTEARYDHNLGGVVSNQHDREELLKRKEAESGKTFTWVDPTDAKSAGVTEEGLDSTARQKINTGERSTQKYW